MKLGFLLFDYFPFGGLQRDCLKLARLCRARGHDVTIFTRTWQGEPEREVQVELFGRHGLTNLARNRAWLRQLTQTLPQRSLDRVIGFNKLPGLDVYYGSDPCYAAKVDRLKSRWHRWLPRYRHFQKLEQAVFSRGSGTQVLVLTQQEIPNYQKHYGTETHRFHVLPPGIERRTFTADQQTQTRTRVRAGLGWAPEEHVLLLVGSGFRVKGLDRAIRALASLPAPLRANSRLAVIGQNRSGEFQLLAKRLGVGSRVEFLGGRNDVFDFLLAADLLIHPAYSEAAGLILLEALSAGLPVLCTDVCGYAPHILRAGAGRVLEAPFSQEQCNLALAEMLAAPERMDWRRNGVSYAAREDLYSCHQAAAQLIEKLPH